MKYEVQKKSPERQASQGQKLLSGHVDATLAAHRIAHDATLAAQEGCYPSNKTIVESIVLGGKNA
jgi:hypothetical protein